MPETNLPTKLHIYTTYFRTKYVHIFATYEIIGINCYAHKMMTMTSHHYIGCIGLLAKSAKKEPFESAFILKFLHSFREIASQYLLHTSSHQVMLGKGNEIIYKNFTYHFYNMNYEEVTE